ncbi:MAG: type 4a pilus biogenesis protein PilO [Legionella sp.]
MNYLNLNELALDDIARWPFAIKISTVVVLVLLLITLGYFLIINQLFFHYTELQDKETVLRSDFELKQHQASNLQAYRNEMQIMRERFGNMLRQLPTENEMPGLLEDLSKTAIASGLTIELFAPSSEVEHDFYSELPIQISALGNYSQIAIFISRVAQMSRIVTMHNFTITNPDVDKQKNNSGDRLQIKLTAKIYRYRSQ